MAATPSVPFPAPPPEQTTVDVVNKCFTARGKLDAAIDCIHRAMSNLPTGVCDVPFQAPYALDQVAKAIELARHAYTALVEARDVQNAIMAEVEDVVKPGSVPPSAFRMVSFDGKGGEA